MSSRAEQIVAALGGAGNIDSLEGCTTRLRTEVKDPVLVDEGALKDAGAHGVVLLGAAVQVVVGTDGEPLADDIHALLHA